MKQRSYIAIDLKSFYASVECVDRGLDPLNTNLVVADVARTEKTICLAVSPSLKSYGIAGRARLFEVVQRVKEVNAARKNLAPKHSFTGKSFLDSELKADPALELDYIAATPRMAKYMEISSKIYGIYLKYIAPEDIHVYSIDEVFIDVTQYLRTYKLSSHGIALMLVRDVLRETGITATAGIGTNLYLAKIAMDIIAKHTQPDKDGVRIAELTEMSYREQLWEHTPLTDFWRIGRGYRDRLEEKGLYTMGDIARCSLGKKTDFYNEDLLYKMFGINAELLIDHAWGYESCTLEDIKAYKPSSSSLSSGQVLKEPYSAEKAKLVIKEMTDSLVLDLVDKGLMTDQIVLSVGYDVENFKDPYKKERYSGEISVDPYGREKPKSVNGSVNLGKHTSSSKIIMDKVGDLFDRIVDKNFTVRRMSVAANDLVPESFDEEEHSQLDLFTDYEKLQAEAQREREEALEENSLQKAVIGLKKKYGKNAVLKGMNFEEGATAIERNGQVGGHKA
ncbi:MAG: DNA methylase [Ruminococcaceae bacterium]|nr:DNA methylase [Oscillospiraceae bacterium]